MRVGNNRPDLGTNPICNRFTGFIDEGKPLFLPCNPPMPGAFVSVHMETASGSTQLSICEAFVYTDQVCYTIILPFRLYLNKTKNFWLLENCQIILKFNVLYYQKILFKVLSPF